MTAQPPYVPYEADYTVDINLKRGIMAKPITQRVADSFDGDDTAARDYADKAYACWGDLSTALRRNAVLALLVAAAFELLVYSKTPSTITFASFSLANSSTVQIALPSVFAFLVYEGFRLSMRWIDVQRMYYSLIKMAEPKAYENGLGVLIRPVLPGFWAIGVSSPQGDELSQRSGRFISIMSSVIGVIILFLFPLVFEGQAFYKLFQKFGYHNPFLWVNAGITVVLIFCTYIYFFMWGIEP